MNKSGFERKFGWTLCQWQPETGREKCLKKSLEVLLKISCFAARQTFHHIRFLAIPFRTHRYISMH